MMALTIPGPPQGKARERTRRNGHTYTPDNTVLYENLVKTEFLRQCGRQRLPAWIRLPTVKAYPASGCGKTSKRRCENCVRVHVSG